MSPVVFYSFLLICPDHRVRGIDRVQCLVVRDSIGVHFHPVLEILHASFRSVVIYLSLIHI